MKKKLLALSVLTAISSQAGAFQFDTGENWQIRWDNTLKGNLMFRTAKQDKDVYDQAQGVAGWWLADDSDLTVDRSNLGVVSTRFDLLSEFDVIFKDDFGFRVSAAAWYDPMYGRDSDHPEDRRATWGQPSVRPGKYTDEAEKWHYYGGEILDAFVFANWDIGETSLGVRAGRHTIYWGNSLLAVGAINGFGGSMAPLDFNKGLAVPGSEAKELFLPTAKISGVFQATDNLTFNAFYNFEHRRYRLPEAGTYFSPITGLTEDSEFITFPPPGPTDDLANPIRLGMQGRKDKTESGDWGINVQYYIESWALETSFIYMNYVDKNLHGASIGSEFGALLGAVSGNLPDPVPGWDEGARPTGYGFWSFKEDIDLLGVSFAKEIAGISVGLDVVYRGDTGLAQTLGALVTGVYNVPAGFDALLPAPLYAIKNPDGTNKTEEQFLGANSKDFPGPVGDTWSVVLNGVGLLTDNGFWQGGSWIAEVTAAMLDKCNEGCGTLDPRIREDRWVTNFSAVFRPTWYQVWPGTDLTVPMSVGYTFGDEAKSPFTFGGDGKGGSFTLGAELLINQVWNFRAQYNARFGPATAGIGGLLKDRDNISLTLKRTF